MRFSNAGRLRVDRNKVVDYLLSARHPDGRSKSAFFSSFGFDAEYWEGFAEALREHGARHEVADIRESDYGTLYIVDGIMETPDGRNPYVRTVWIIDEGNAEPRLVTAHPLRG